MLKMTLKGEPFSFKLKPISATEDSYAFKIAHDEPEVGYWPGVLLELENVHFALDLLHLKWMDSCTDPGSS